MTVLIAVLKYSELSPQIQLEFKRYLERFEINQALANFIISFAEYKKHEVRTDRMLSFDPLDLNVAL